MLALPTLPPHPQVIPPVSGGCEWLPVQELSRKCTPPGASSCEDLTFVHYIPLSSTRSPCHLLFPYLDKLRHCPSCSRRRDRINLGLLRSYHKGGGYKFAYHLPAAQCVFCYGSPLDSVETTGSRLAGALCTRRGIAAESSCTTAKSNDASGVEPTSSVRRRWGLLEPVSRTPPPVQDVRLIQ